MGIHLFEGLNASVILGPVAIALEESLCNFRNQSVVLGLPVDLALKESS